MSPALLSPLGLAVVTGAQRDALTPSAGQLVWNSETTAIEVWRDAQWQEVAIDADLAQFVWLLILELGRVRTALRFMGIDPAEFPADST